MVSAAPTSGSFTFKSNGGLLRVLNTHCHVRAGFDPALQTGNVPVQFQAIWDSGATGSVITKQVAQACCLLPTGMTQVRSVGRLSISPTYWSISFFRTMCKSPTCLSLEVMS
jgi:hypothetical protein